MMTDEEIVQIIEARFDEKFAVLASRVNGPEPSSAAKKILYNLFCAGVDLGVELCSAPIVKH
jgi:hypothetical protein